ncbi:alpha/beta hydrolase family protein [Clostridium polynesiense]|uniref:alpha/beta hydrolase family protein n=1 Tax=Clostridium polynesiense TaxID=1325933 RepID=UPI00058CBEF5|nr:S9 family peptidase [Clostridium polynesiense]
MESLKIDDFTGYKFLSGIKHSPDGKHAAFVVHSMDFDENKYLSNLWVLEVETEKYYQLTAFDSERSFLWLDNDNIIFPDARDSRDKEKLEAGEEFTQYYKININGGEALKYFKIPKLVSSIKKAGEEMFLFTSPYSIGRSDISFLTEEEKKKELKFRKEEKDYEVLEEIPFWSNGGGFTNKKRNRLYSYNEASHDIEEITDESVDVDLFNINEDKSKAVLLLSDFKDKRELTNLIAVYDIKSKKLQIYDYQASEGETENSEGLSHSFADFISDDRVIYSATNMKRYGVNENDKFYILDLNSGKSVCITPDLDAALTNSVGSDCRYGGASLKEINNGYLYYVTTEGHNSYLNRIDAQGKIEKIITGEGSVDGISINKESLLFIGMKTDKLQELYKFTIGTEKQITDMNGWVNSERKLSTPEKLSIETSPGVVIEGWIMKPVDFDENKKYPAILDIHGGPKTVYGTVFYHEMQYWANEGYAVFFCNPRGSDGGGNAFADIRGKYGTIDYDDIMAFTDEVIKRFSFIDKEKVGVTGGSYGGFMTNWIIGHTDRFKAAASQRSISNWISKFCTTDIGYFFVDDQCQGTPWVDQEKLWEQSPLKYADKVKTPTLFIHSEEDYRCWLAEGIQMFTALKYHGVDSRLCMFRGENHELSRSGKPKHRLRRLQEITQWFNKHLK